MQQLFEKLLNGSVYQCQLSKHKKQEQIEW